MKEEHKLSHIIKEGFQDMFYIWKDELKAAGLSGLICVHI